MRINTYTQQAIVSSILNDVPDPAKKINKEEIQALFTKAMSAPVRRFFKLHPEAVKTEYFNGHRYGLDFSGQITSGDADVAVVFAPFLEKEQARSAARSKVHTAIKSCTTLKQLTERFPEFIKYYPTEDSPTKNLPAVIDVAKDLKALGWPKSKAKITI